MCFPLCQKYYLTVASLVLASVWVWNFFYAVCCFVASIAFGFDILAVIFYYLFFFTLLYFNFVWLPIAYIYCSIFSISKLRFRVKISALWTRLCLWQQPIYDVYLHLVFIRVVWRITSFWHRCRGLFCFTFFFGFEITCLRSFLNCIFVFK